MMRRAVSVFCIIASSAACLFADTSPQQRGRDILDRGLAYLKSQQKPDGGWQKDNEPPAVTALVLRAFVLDEKYDAKTDFVRKGYEKLLSYQLDSGGIYKDLLANYNTAIAVGALAAAEEPEFKDRLDKARSEEHTSELQSRLHLVCR